MPWQIQCRRKVDGEEWEPISVERCQKIADAYERQYHYESQDDAKRAFAEYVDIEGGLPNLLVRLATGSEKFTNKYEVRFVQLLPENEQPASGPGGFAAVPPGSESALREWMDIANRNALERESFAAKLRQARRLLQYLRDGVDTEEVHCTPVPLISSWRYVIDKALGILDSEPAGTEKPDA